MANKLRRVPSVRYTAGVPAVASAPAYCTLEPVYSDFGEYAAILAYEVRLAEAMYRNKIGTSFRGSSGGIGSVTIPPNLSSMFGYSFSQVSVWYYKKTCHPATKGSPGVSGSTAYGSAVGWDSGAISVGGFNSDGYAEFTIGESSAGVVVGISTGPDTQSPLDASHAFFYSGKNLNVFESGAIVFTVPGGLSGSPRLRIERRGSAVRYFVGGALVHTSLKGSAGYARLDASLYAVGDYVEGPIIGALHSRGAAGAIGVTAGISSRPRAKGSIGISGSARGRNGSIYRTAANGSIGLSGSSAGRANSFGGGSGSVGATGEASAAVNVSRGLMPRFSGASGRADYASSAGSYRGIPLGRAEGGYPLLDIGMASGIVPAPIGFSLCLSGGVLSSAGAGPAALGVSADRAYSASAGVYLGRYSGVSYEPWLSPGAALMQEPVLLHDRFELFAEAWATFGSIINTSSGLLIEVEVSQGLHWLDTLMLASSARELSDRLAEFGSTLMLTNSSDPNGLRSMQTATNVQTGAVTHYSQFDFIASNKVGGITYLLCADGVYSLDRGGEVMPMAADLGGSEFGTTQGKRFDSIYIAGETDGKLTVRVQADKGAQCRYQATGTASMLRVKPALGLKGRTWRIQLEIADAEHAEILSVEPVIGTSGRRL